MRAVYLIVAALVILIVTALVVAPAQWAASYVRSASNGRVELAEANGTIWNGSAIVVIASPAETGASRASLPERLSWRLSPWALLAGQIDLALTHPSALSQPLTVNAPLFGKTVTLGPATMRLPASLLVGLGAPWNTIRPGGILTVSWDRLAVEPGRWQGRLSGEWQYASSGLTPVSPMGHYRPNQWHLAGNSTGITNHFGSPRAEGQWHNQRGGRLRFTGRAQAVAGTDPGVKAQLTG